MGINGISLQKEVGVSTKFKQPTAAISVADISAFKGALVQLSSTKNTQKGEKHLAPPGTIATPPTLSTADRHTGMTVPSKSITSTLHTDADYRVGAPQRPDIWHDNGFLQNPKDSRDPKPLSTIEPTDADKAYYQEQVRLSNGGMIATAIRADKWAKWAIPDQYEKFLDSPDGIKAYRHFLVGQGSDRTFSFDKYVNDDASGKMTLRNVTIDLQKGVQDLYAKMLQTDPSLVGQSISFQVTGDKISVGSSAQYPYPATDNWQKAIGGFSVWSSADVTVTPSKTPGGEPSFLMNMTLHAEDRYNFNPKQHDIETGTPDSLRGRLAQTGLAKQYMHYGTLSQEVTWTGGEVADSNSIRTSSGR